MAKKAQTRSESKTQEQIKARDEEVKAERQADVDETHQELVENPPHSAAKRETVREAKQDLREASQETQERAQAVPSLGQEAEQGQRHELPISDSNPPSDQSIHEMTTTDLHPSVTTPQGTQADSIGDAHELRDVNFRALAGWFVGLFAIIGITLWLMAVMFNVLLATQQYKEEMPSPLVTEATLEAPRARPLLPAPEVPLQEYNQSEEQFMAGYSRDPRSGEVRIPIERAMELMAQNRLPSTPQATIPQTSPRTDLLPGQPSVKEPIEDWQNPADFIPPSNLGVGRNDPNLAFRIPREGNDFPSGRLQDSDRVNGHEQAGEH